jgi:hypothetical protein
MLLTAEQQVLCQNEIVSKIKELTCQAVMWTGAKAN